MSTRCQVVVKDSFNDEIWFYRHSDGYPEGVKESLETFLSWVKEKRIRDNAEQSAGWLIIIGHQDYNVPDIPKKNFGGNINDGMHDWKVGAYEPCSPEEHGDIEYLYTIDLTKKQIFVKDIYKKTETLFLE
jgi:hypothetical protein